MKTNTTLEYVFSAVDQGFYLKESPGVLEGTLAMTKIFKDDVRSHCKHYNPEISLLYNAYTEKKLIDKFKSLKNLETRAIYADSGGLQIVTRGKEITEKVKDQIYLDQAYADYGMCFDVMPITKSNATKKQTRNERSNMGSRIFHPSLHKEAGRLTGVNVKKQIASYRKIGAKTKAIIIVQGNTFEEMVMYYEQIAKQLKDEDYDHIGGMAISGACIGRGELESIEILRAAHLISKKAHGNISKHFHLLGIGSIARMKSVIYLKRSGYLDSFDHISFDSTSHTSTMTYGLMKLNGGCKALGSHRGRKTEEQFSNIYDLFKPYIKKHATKDEYLDLILGKIDPSKPLGTADDWRHGSILKRSDSVLGKLSVNAYTLYQVNNFLKCLDDLWDDEFAGDPTTALLRVKNDDDMQQWFGDYGRELSSNRISRASTTLEGFL